MDGHPIETIRFSARGYETLEMSYYEDIKKYEYADYKLSEINSHGDSNEQGGVIN